jgi:hypothetical protein
VRSQCTELEHIHKKSERKSKVRELICVKRACKGGKRIRKEGESALADCTRGPIPTFTCACARDRVHAVQPFSTSSQPTMEKERALASLRASLVYITITKKLCPCLPMLRSLRPCYGYHCEWCAIYLHFQYAALVQLFSVRVG